MKEININIEGYNVNGICVGCLNYNRKMYYDDKVKECFKQIGNIDVPDGLTIQVCWECLAAVKNVLHFQTQILRSYEVLISYSQQYTFLNSPEDFTRYATTRLSTSLVTSAESVSFTTSVTPTDSCDIEVEVKEDVKEELSDTNADFVEIETEAIKDEPELQQDTYSEDFQSQELSSDEEIQLSKLKKRKKKDKKKKEKKKDENCNLRIDSANDNMAQNYIDPLSTIDSCVIRSDSLIVLLENLSESLEDDETAAEKSAVDKNATMKSVVNKTAAEKSVEDKTAAEKSVADNSATEKSVADNSASDKSVADNSEMTVAEKPRSETNIREVGDTVTIETDSDSNIDDFPTMSNVITTKNTNVNNDVVVSRQRNEPARPCFQKSQHPNCSKSSTFQNAQSSIDTQLASKISDISTTVKSVLESQRILGENQQVFSLELAKVRDNQQNVSLELAKLNINLEVFMKGFMTRDIKLENNTHFNPIENMEDLDQLENNLKDPGYKAELKKKFSVICGKQIGKGLNAAYKFVDLIFHRDFLKHCSWAGGSRSDEQKICFKVYHQTIDFFFNLVKDTDSLYTLEDCESFFKTILRNSRKRSMGLNMRQSTKRMRKKMNMHVIQGRESSDVARDNGIYVSEDK